MTNRFITLCICSMMIVFSGFSQAQYNLHFTTYTNSNGLPPGSFNKIIKGPKGFLWLISENGISKFNGYDFSTYHFNSKKLNAFSSTQILQSYVDSSGNLFFASKNSLFHFNYKTETFEKIINYAKFNDLVYFGSDNKLTYALVNNVLYTIDPELNYLSRIILTDSNLIKSTSSVLLTKDKFYFLTPSHFIALDRKTNTIRKTFLKSPLGIQCFIYKDKLEQIYISSYKKLFQHDSKTNLLIELKARPSEYAEVRNMPLAKIRKEHLIYVCSKAGLLTQLDLITGEVKEVNIKSQLQFPTTDVISFHNPVIGSNNNLWIETEGGGLIEVDLSNFQKGISRSFNTTNTNISSNNCNSILDDKDGLIWILSPGKGLIKGEKIKLHLTTIYPGAFTSHSTLSNNNIRSLKEIDSNRLAVATLQGSYLITFKKPHAENSKLDYTEDLISTLPFSDISITENKNLWFASWRNQSILEYHPSSKTQIKINQEEEGKKGNVVFRSSYKYNDVTYFGTSGNSIHKIEPYNSTVKNLKTTEILLKRDSLSKNLGVIFCIQQLGKNHLLIGSQNGLYRYNTLNDSISAFKPGSKELNTLFESDIRSILVFDSSNIWIGTNGIGLIHLNLELNAIKNYSVEDGLSDNSVYTILDDRHGKLWLGTNTGLNKFDPKLETFQIYSEKDGAGFNEFNTNAACKMSDGRMAFGGINGFIIFHPDSMNITTNPIHLYLTQFLINNQVQKLDSIYKLKYDENYLSFQFSALTFFRNEDIKYAYKMVGLDDDWILCGTRRFTTYANLQPGTYTFQVRCTNPNGVWNKEMLSISILILNPWYKEWYAISLYLILIAAAIWGIYSYRQNQRLKLQTIRDNIARDLHDEIGSNLSSISIFNEVAKESALRNSGNLSSILNKIGEYTQVSQEAMNDIVWMIDSKNERFENIFIKMRTLASETIGAGSYVMSLNFDEALNDVKIPMAKRKNFYLIYKEAINNLLKYSQCTHVNIEIRKIGNHVLLHIEDNGVGFIINEKKGNGLTNMRKRASELHGDLQIFSTIGKGTVIKLKFPI